ncbi:MAG: arylsulfatase, partial [Myxococcota bacterium]
GHVETVIVDIHGEVWKYSRYFDNTQFWSDPDTPKDVVIGQDDSRDLPGETEVTLPKTVKRIPKPDEYEMYNVTRDPMEHDNLVDDPAEARMRRRLEATLDEQRAQKRLYPVSE